MVRNRTSGLQGNQKLRDEVRQRADHGRRADLAIRRDQTRRLRRTVASKCREAPQGKAFGLREQLIAPVHRRTQCLVPGQSRSAAARQHSKAIIQTCGDLLEPKGGVVSWRQIDGQRNGIEAPTDFKNWREVLYSRREIRVQRACRGDEELHRAPTQYIVGFLVLRGHIQRGKAVNVLSLDLQDLPARCKYGGSWTHA